MEEKDKEEKSGIGEKSEENGQSGENANGGEETRDGAGRHDDEKLEFRGLGRTAERAESKLSNFWYYHKWKVIIAAFFSILIGVSIFQIVTRDSPDINVMYAGPGYSTAVEVESIRTALRSVAADYNGDGKVGASLLMLTCLTDEQIEERHQEALDESRLFVINRDANLQNIKQFDNEIMYGDSIICFLDPALYDRVREAGGFMRMDDIFTEEELSGMELYDGSGVYLSSLKFTEVNSVFKSFPPDTIMCIRKLSSMSSFFKGGDKYEKRHEDHIETFRNIVLFEYPEGFVPESETSGEK